MKRPRWMMASLAATRGRGWLVAEPEDRPAIAAAPFRYRRCQRVHDPLGRTDRLLRLGDARNHPSAGHLAVCVAGGRRKLPYTASHS